METANKKQFHNPNHVSENSNKNDTKWSWIFLHFLSVDENLAKIRSRKVNKNNFPEMKNAELSSRPFLSTKFRFGDLIRKGLAIAIITRELKNAFVHLRPSFSVDSSLSWVAGESRMWAHRRYFIWISYQACRLKWTPVYFGLRNIYSWNPSEFSLRFNHDNRSHEM